MVTLKQIRIYPIKSLDPVICQQTLVLREGALYGDRQYALMDRSNKLINGKRDERVHSIHSIYDSQSKQLELGLRGEPLTRFDFVLQRSDLEHWLSNHFDQPVKLAENMAGGFPDDTVAPGPTLISTATLETVASWFPALSVEELRLRVRANLEIDGVPPFWEDRLYGPEGSPVPFRIGEMIFYGVNPCQRCKVLMRDSQTGKLQADFKAIFRQYREESLPDWVERSRFNHFFRLAVNTTLGKANLLKRYAGEIQPGDVVSII